MLPFCPHCGVDLCERRCRCLEEASCTFLLSANDIESEGCKSTVNLSETETAKEIVGLGATSSQLFVRIGEGKL